MLLDEVPLLGRVRRPSYPDNCHVSRVDVRQLDHPGHVRPVREPLSVHVRLAVDVGVEVDVAELLPFADALRQGLSDRDRQRVVTSDADRHRPGVEDPPDVILDVVPRSFSVGGDHRYVATVDQAELLEQVDIEVAQIRQILVGYESHHLRGEARPCPVHRGLVERHSQEHGLRTLALDRLRLARHPR
jgi:hypothetical protein